MDTNGTKDISDDTLDEVVAGTVSASQSANTAKKKTTDVVEHHEGGDHSTG